MRLSFSLARVLVNVFVIMIGLAVPIGLLWAAPDGGVVGNGTPGSCTECVASNTTGANVPRMIARLRMS